MTEPQLFTLTRRPRGRPKKAETQVLSSVSTRLLPVEHDGLVKLAEARGVSVSAVIRALIRVGQRRVGQP
jgi:hypothetical protein